MNILFLTDSFLPHAGGSRVYYHNLLKNLVAQFPDQVTVLTKKVPGWEEFDRRESSDRLKIVRQFKPLVNWKIHQWPKTLPVLVAALWQCLWQRPDLVHVGDLFPQGLVAVLLKKMMGIPYVAYCHGEEVTQTDERRYQPIFRNLIYREASAVIAACEFAREKVVGLGVPADRVWKISPGVEAMRFSPRQPNPQLLRRYGLEGKRVVLTVARLCPRKGHDMVMRALAQLAPSLPDLGYVIAGKGPEERRLRLLARDLGINAKVTFVGYVPEEKLPDFYSLCDVFVMANREQEGDVEGFGMVFPEAGAAGKPVIGGRSGGTADSIVDGVTGFRVDPCSVDEIAQALRRCLTDPGLRLRLGEAGLHRARTLFGWSERTRLLREVSEGAALQPLEARHTPSDERYIQS